MRWYFMEIVYHNQDDFSKFAYTSFSHKVLEDKQNYYHILDQKDKNFFYLKETEPTKLQVLNELKDFQQFLKIKELIFDKKQNNEYLGYSESKYKKKSFANQLREIPESDKLTTISIYFQELNRLIQKGHQLNIVFPNLFSDYSIIYDINEETLYLSGVDTLQVENYQSIHVNPFLNDDRILERIYGSIKYFDNQKILYRPNFDQLNLINQFFIYTLGLNLSHEIITQEELGIPCEQTLQTILKQHGLSNENELYQYLKHIYLYEENQSYVDDAYPYIERLECNYQLNKQSQFVKRKRFII